jgi:hypothetical protein
VITCFMYVLPSINANGLVLHGLKMARLATFQKQIGLKENELKQLEQQLNLINLEDFLQADPIEISSSIQLSAQVSHLFWFVCFM